MVAPQPFYEPRGTPIAVRAAAEALGQAGHRVDLLTLGHGEDVDLPNVRIHRALRAPFVRSVPIGPSLRKAASDAMLLRPLLRLAEEGRHDVVHGVEEGALLAWWLHRRTGIPFVYDMDSHLSAQLAERGHLFRPAGKLVKALERRALREAVGVLAVCPALLDVATRHHPRETAALLPDGPLQDGERTEPSRELVGLGGTRIVYVGNLQPYQGVDLLLEGFRRVAPRHPDARLVIVGGSAGEVAHYARSAGRLEREGRVRLLGPRPLTELGGILAGAHIVASPRLQGVNTPMKIYSYLESGRPLLATRLVTHTQVLDDDVACLVAPTAEGLADGLHRLLSDADLRRNLGEAGRRRVRRLYGLDRFRSRLHAFYGRIEERVTGTRSPAAPAAPALRSLEAR